MPSSGSLLRQAVVSGVYGVAAHSDAACPRTCSTSFPVRHPSAQRGHPSSAQCIALLVVTAREKPPPSQDVAAGFSPVGTRLLLKLFF